MRAKHVGMAVVLGVLALPQAVRGQGGDRRPMSIDDIMSIRNVFGLALSPDGRRVAYAVSAWEHPSAKGDTAKGDKHETRSHLWLVSTDAGGSDARQITFGERGEGSPGWSPNGATISFTTARG